MEFAQKLKSLRLERGFTQKELASTIGVSTVTIQCWERGEKKPSMDALISLSKTLRTSVDKLLGIETKGKNHSFIMSREELNLLRDYRSLDTYGQKAVRTICEIEKERIEKAIPSTAHKVVTIESAKPSERYIPHYATPSAAGISVPLDGDDFEMMLVDNSIPAQADYAVNIQGDSMNPYINDGDVVYVEKDAELCIGDIGIFSVNGAMYCKMYYLDEQKNLVLVSANPDLKHTNVFVSAESSNDVRCCGKVLLGCRTELPDYIFED